MNFEPAGSISRPGPIGRFTRIGFGVFTIYGLVLVLGATGYLWVNGVPINLMFALGAAFCIYTIPPVVNIGYGVSWGRALRIGVLTAIGLAAIAGWVVHRDPLGPYAGVTVGAVMVLVLVQLGPSLVLSGILAVPG